MQSSPGTVPATEPVPDTAGSDGAANVRGRLAEIRTRISEAASAVGRSPDSITLVAVSKTVGRPKVEAMLVGGHRHFGENRVQEAASKFPELRARHPDVVLHLIGSLQTNKARDAVRLADVIESLDRPKLANAIEQAAGQEGRLPQLLVQVNIGDEPQKSGVLRAEADAFIEGCMRRFGSALAGVMCVPPADADPAPHFMWLRDCARRHGLRVISMGMSHDFEVAIRCGATEVRVGSAIFGARS